MSRLKKIVDNYMQKVSGFSENRFMFKPSR